MNSVLAREAFSVGARTYVWRDVLLAAVLRDDWFVLAGRVESGLALVRQAEEADDAPSDRDLDAAGEEFRYERDLITAEEMEAWLERGGLTIEDWVSYLERAILRANRSEQVVQALSEYPPSAEEVAGCLWAEAVCSGELTRFAEVLAGRAAFGERTAAPGDDALETAHRNGLERLLRKFPESLARSGFADLVEAWHPETLEALALLELHFESLSRRLQTPSAIRAQIEMHRLDWVRLDLRDVLFGSAEAAREAALCLREDGEPLESVAARAHVPVQTRRLYLSDADPAIRTDLLGAQPGQVLGPFQLEDGFHLLLVCDRTMPSEADSDFQKLAADVLMQGLIEREAEARVRWRERF